MKSVFCLTALLCVGCGGVTNVQTQVTHPAAIPVFTYPHVLVVFATDTSTRRIGLSAGAYLARHSRSKVSYPTAADIARRREQHNLPNGSVVMEVRTEFERGFSSDWVLRPRTTCGPGGCVTRERRVWVSVPTLSARVRLRIADGPTGRELQRINFAVKQRSRNGFSMMRNRAIERLVDKFQQRLVRSVKTQKVALRRIDEIPAVQEAIVLAESGDWHAARELVEAVRKDDDTKMYPSHVLAKFYHNLALFRHHDTKGFKNFEARIKASRKSMRRAVSLDSKISYVNALATLVEDGRREVLLRQQEEAERHNFQLRGVRGTAPIQAIPDAPDSYRDVEPGSGVKTKTAPSIPQDADLSLGATPGVGPSPDSDGAEVLRRD